MKFWRKQIEFSLVSRLTLLFGVAAFATVSVCTGYLYLALKHTLRLQSAHLLMDRMEVIETLVVGQHFSVRDLVQHIEQEWSLREFERVYVRVLDDRGELVAQTLQMPAQVLRELQEGWTVTPPGSATPEKMVEHRNSEDFLSAEEILPVNNLWTEYLRVQVALDRSHEFRVLIGYRNQVYFAIPLVFLLCGFVGWHLARRGVRPIFRIAQETKKIQVNSLGGKIAVENLPVELRVLATDFNSMLKRLNDSFDRLSRFSADIAHELRTPLNNMHGELEVVLSKPRRPEHYRDVLGSCLEECAKIERILDSLLFLAWSENPELHLKTEAINLSAELHHVLEFYEASATEAGVVLETQVDSALLIEVEKTLFQRAIGNLIANAIRHTGAGGRVGLSASVQDRFVWVSVADTGSGISAEHLPFVFDRFYRVDQSRSKQSGGSGLGLAIVQSIASSHGGEVRMHSVPGEGTRVDISFPLAVGEFRKSRQIEKTLPTGPEKNQYPIELSPPGPAAGQGAPPART